MSNLLGEWIIWDTHGFMIRSDHPCYTEILEAAANILGQHGHENQSIKILDYINGMEELTAKIIEAGNPYIHPHRNFGELLTIKEAKEKYGTLATIHVVSPNLEPLRLVPRIEDFSDSLVVNALAEHSDPED